MKNFDFFILYQKILGEGLPWQQDVVGAVFFCIFDFFLIPHEILVYISYDTTIYNILNWPCFSSNEKKTATETWIVS